MEQKRTIVGIYDHWQNQESYIHVNDGTQHRIASIKYSEMFIACIVMSSLFESILRSINSFSCENTRSEGAMDADISQDTSLPSLPYLENLIHCCSTIIFTPICG